MHLPVWQVLAQPDPAAHPRPQPPLAAPERAGGGYPAVASRASRTAVTARMCASRGSAGAVRGVAQAARGQPGPGQPRPRPARPEPGRLGVPGPPPEAVMARACGSLDAEHGGQLVELHAVHVGDEQQPRDVPSGKVRGRGRGGRAA